MSTTAPSTPSSHHTRGSNGLLLAHAPHSVTQPARHGTHLLNNHGGAHYTHGTMRPTHAHHSHAHSHVGASLASAVAPAGSSSSAIAQPAASAHVSSSSSAAPAPPPAASATPLLVDLVRKLASFRRGLVLERKQRQLLELQLEEAQLKNEALSQQQREQDVQLLTSLELSASLEHALHMSAVDVPSLAQGGHERQLEGIFAKPKKEAEQEIKKLFAELR